jgi:hypothetical protein
MLARTFPLFLILATITLASPSVTIARSFWTDANGDGLPDQGGPGTPMAVGDTVLIDLWIDSGDLVWEDFMLQIGWPRSFRRAGVGYYPDFTGGWWLARTDTIGFWGFGYSESGIDRIGWLRLRSDEGESGCTDPIIGEDRFGLSSRLQFNDSIFYFSDRDVSCFASPVPNATETRTWGQVKALYR